MNESVVALLSIVLMIAFCEWREFKLRVELSKVSAELSKFSVACYSRLDQMELEYSEAKAAISELNKIQAGIAASQAETREFAHKASLDLGTIVQEYEINGIWLGKDRNKHVDAYEG